jgi:hypothetical protein
MNNYRFEYLGTDIDENNESSYSGTVHYYKTNHKNIIDPNGTILFTAGPHTLILGFTPEGRFVFQKTFLSIPTAGPDQEARQVVTSEHRQIDSEGPPLPDPAWVDVAVEEIVVGGDLRVHVQITNDGGADGDGVRVDADYYGEAYAQYKGDLVICRQVLEHIETPGAFVDLLRSAMKDDSAALFIEVPNGMYTLETGHIWDLIYEHCSYFCASSLARILNERGLGVTRLAPAYHDQFLCAEAGAMDGGGRGRISAAGAPESIAHVETFHARFHAMIRHWREMIESAARAERTVVAWGAGSKGVTFLNLVDRDLGAVRHIVDVNPRKRGKFVAGAGQEIVAPADLTAIRPDLVLLMNPIYLDEVRGQLAELGLSPVVEVVRETDMAAPAPAAAS